MVTELKNATITGVVLETITMGNGQQRSLLRATCAINGRDGVESHGFEVWGQDTIDRLGIEKDKVFNISCRLVGRIWGGRYSYTLQAYASEPVVINNSKDLF